MFRVIQGLVGLIDSAGNAIGSIIDGSIYRLQVETKMEPGDRAALDSVNTNIGTVISDGTVPLGAFGEGLFVQPTPIVQIDAVYGLLSTDHELKTSGSGSTSAQDSVFIVSSGTTANSLARIRSVRVATYRPGQGIRARFTAAFTTGVADSLQIAGATSITDGLWFGYNGATYGLFRVIPGSVHIERLTITNGTGGSPETATVTLNGTAFNVSLDADLTASQVATRIAERVGGYDGWDDPGVPTSNGVTVTFMQDEPAPAPGTFSFGSTGSATGTFSTISEGAANDYDSGFVAQSNWNVDVMDGTGPSGMTIDPTKLNVYEITLTYLGAGTIEYHVMTPTNGFATVHKVPYPNSSTSTHQKNPTYHVGWISRSLGSTTDLTVRGASGAIFTEGAQTTVRSPFSAVSEASVTTTEYAIMAMRVRNELNGTFNKRVVYFERGNAAVETANRVVIAKMWLNPTVSQDVEWSYLDENNSCIETAQLGTATVTNGQLLATEILSSGAPASVDMSHLDIRLRHGDVIVFTAQTINSSTELAIGFSWREI